MDSNAISSKLKICYVSIKCYTSKFHFPHQRETPSLLILVAARGKCKQKNNNSKWCHHAWSRDYSWVGIKLINVQEHPPLTHDTWHHILPIAVAETSNGSMWEDKCTHTFTTNDQFQHS